MPHLSFCIQYSVLTKLVFHLELSTSTVHVSIFMKNVAVLDDAQ